MTKTKIFILSIALAGISCKSTDSNKKNSEDMSPNISEIEVNAITRGYKEDISVTPTQFTFNSTNERIKKEITAEEWITLSKTLEDVQLENLDDLTAPTDRRFYDGDLATQIVVKTKDSVYSSISFDKKTPPAELESLMNRLYELKTK